MIEKDVIEKERISSIASQSPLIRVNPITTAFATREHLRGLVEMLTQRYGSKKTQEANISIANNMIMAEQAVKHLQGCLEEYAKSNPYYVELEKEVNTDGE